MQHGPVEKQQRAQGLVRGRRADVVSRGQRREEALDVGCAESRGVPSVIEDDEAADPVAIGVFGTRAEVSEAAGVADLVHQPR